MEELENKNVPSDVHVQDELENLKKSLNYERSKRKELEKKLASKDEEETEDIKKEEEKIRNKLKNGQSELSDDVINDIMSALGKSQAEMTVRGRKQNIERDILELKRDPMYMDIEEYGDEIRKLIKQNGLSVEQAYWAVAGRNKANLNTKDKDDEAKKLNRERAKEAYADPEPAGIDNKPTYTAKERAIADTLNITAEEVRERSKQSMSISDILKMNKKFKKE